MVKRINSKLIAGIASCLTLGIPTTAFAAYVPPTDQVPPYTRGGTGGTRGSCESLTPLAPINYLGQTIATRPTFSWVANGKESIPLEFLLYEYEPSDTSLTLKQKTTLKSTQGLMSFSIPQDWAELSVGKIYAWQVVALCDRQSYSNLGYRSPSQNAWLRNPIKVVEITDKLSQSLAQTSEPLQKITLYAEAGLWYDALALTLNPLNSEMKQAQLNLLSKLANVEKLKEPKNSIPESKFSYALEQFVIARQKQDFK